MLDLGEVILLRGWVKGLATGDLKDYTEEDESVKRKLKALRLGLANKARFYRQPEWRTLWSGERHPGTVWQARALASLEALNKLPDPAPAPGHGIDQWFNAPICQALPSGLATLSDLGGWLMSHFRGEMALPEASQRHLRRLVKFYGQHSGTLGIELKKQPAAQPVVLFEIKDGIAPLEHAVIPTELNGKQGSNRSPGPCRINAEHDLDAITSWLALHEDSPKTYQAYKKELERLLLWAIVERKKALSSLNTDDCKAYLRFLKQLTAADTLWVSTGPPNKNRGQWRPFYYRLRLDEVGGPEGGTVTIDPHVLSPRSVNYAKTVASNCMAWLADQHYLRHNNFAGIPPVKFAQPTSYALSRAFTLAEMESVFDYASKQVKAGSSDYPGRLRDLFILRFAFSTGLRLQELAAASFGDIEVLSDPEGEHYFLNVVGKGNKARKTSLPEAFVEELKAYLKARRMPASFRLLPQDAPLIPSLKDAAGRKHLTTTGLHKAISQFFLGMLREMEAGPEPDGSLLAKLRKASMHWLRHSYGSYLANDRQIPLTYIRDELGHANISTTSIYLNTADKLRQREVSKAFAGFGAGKT